MRPRGVGEGGRRLGRGEQLFSGLYWEADGWMDGCLAACWLSQGPQSAARADPCWSTRGSDPG